MDEADGVAERSGSGAGERSGRPPVTSAHDLAAVAQRMFVAGGFDETSVDDIAAAAGIGRRTFFRYFPTKADVLFADSPRELEQLRRALAAARPGEPYRAVVTRAVVETLRIRPGEEQWALHRAQLVLTVPAVQAHATRVWAQWRGLAVDYARTVPHTHPLFPPAVGHAVLAATLAAHEHWLTVPDEDLGRLLTGMLDLLLPAEPDAPR